MYTKIEDVLWKDEKFKKCSTESKVLFIYLLTNQHRNMIGLYYLPNAYTIHDTGLTETQFKKSISELFVKGFVTVDKDAEMVLINNFLRYNQLENPKQVIGAIKKLNEIPNSFLISTLLEKIDDSEDSKLIPFKTAIKERVSKGYANGFTSLPIQETETEEETEEETVKDIKRTYGAYNNVKLTDDEYHRLSKDYGEDNRNRYIEFLSSYREEKGYKNKNDNLSIRRWVIDAVNEKRLITKTPEPVKSKWQ